VSQKVVPPDRRAEQPATPDRAERDRPDRPVLWGLVALVGVGLVIGLLASLGATAAGRVLGLSEDGGTATDEASAEQSMYLPSPSPSGRGGSAPLISAGPGKQPESQRNREESGAEDSAITLEAGQQAVGSMERIDLVGSYPGGEGAVLQVQRKEGGSWTDFPVSVTVSDGRFSTYIQTGRTGKGRFRVADTDSDAVSNAVTVQVG